MKKIAPVPLLVRAIRSFDASSSTNSQTTSAIQQTTTTQTITIPPQKPDPGVVFQLKSGIEFRGSYAGGKSDLIIRLKEVQGGTLRMRQVKAEFDFISNHKAPGCYSLEGEWDSKTGALTLRAKDWIKSPGLFGLVWTMVSPTGEVSSAGVYTGHFIEMPGERFNVRIKL